jgi:asparagine synthase (glutamine-hydrolysing)
MCGICGGIGPNAPTPKLIETQLQSLEHRGPDDRGIYSAQGISLGMCRLAIVEVSDGKQPAKDANQRVFLVFNGEIYNFRELRKELIQDGVRFDSSSESEVLIQLYLKHGIRFVDRLNGMFAIALYDKRSGTLSLIRDRIGKKPLWYAFMPDRTLLFASEVKALLKVLPSKTLRKGTISDVMQFGFINSPHSSYNEINQVEPGAILTWNNGALQSDIYWEPNFQEIPNLDFAEALETTKKLISRSVARRLISERPIGAFLSGGYDSTVVAAYMATLYPGIVKTFSIGFEHDAFNESHHARSVAKYLGTEHHELIVRPDPSLLVERLSTVLDQPLADPSIIPSYLLSEFARNSVVVALGGDGGDEVFAGYDRYLAAPILQKFNSLLFLAKYPVKFLIQMDIGNSRKLSRIESQMSRKSDLASRYQSIMSSGSSSELHSILDKQFHGNLSHPEFENDFNSGSSSNLNRMLRADLERYLPGDLLPKADFASMSNSLELRSPLLDIEVVEWGLTLPKEFKISGFETKHILKEVARSLVPREIIDRPKMGFGIPRAQWLRSEMKELSWDILTDQTARSRGWFNATEVNLLLKQHSAGRDKDHLLWPMIILELWARNWLD